MTTEYPGQFEEGSDPAHFDRAHSRSSGAASPACDHERSSARTMFTELAQRISADRVAGSQRAPPAPDPLEDPRVATRIDARQLRLLTGMGGGEWGGPNGLKRRALKDFISNVLSRDERLIIILYYYEGMTMIEIAETLECSEARVCRLYKAAVARLVQIPALTRSRGRSRHRRAGGDGRYRKPG